jgi:hypothetical protein
MFPDRLTHIREQLARRAADLHAASEAHAKAELDEARVMDLLERVMAELHMTALRVETAHAACDALLDEIRDVEDAQAGAMVTP